jgi:hypothetical protein
MGVRLDGGGGEPGAPGSVARVRIGVDGQGSCFFHSVAFLLNPRYCNLSIEAQQACGEGMRAKLAAELGEPGAGKARWARFLDTPMGSRLLKQEPTARKLSAVIAWFQKPTVWANEIMIAYVSWRLNLDIVFIDAVNTQVYCDTLPEGTAPRPTIMVIWVEQEHFEPVAVIDPAASQRTLQPGDSLELLTVLDPARHADLIRRVRQTYKQQCPHAKIGTPSAQPASSGHAKLATSV